MPFSEPAGSTGVSNSTLPIADAAGQVTGRVVPLPSCSSVQAPRPFAAEGLMVMPSGSVTCASLSVAVSGWSLPLGLRGRPTSIVTPDGAPATRVSTATPTVGENGSSSQPLAPIGVSVL